MLSATKEYWWARTMWQVKMEWSSVNEASLVYSHESTFPNISNLSRWEWLTFSYWCSKL